MLSSDYRPKSAEPVLFMETGYMKEVHCAIPSSRDCRSSAWPDHIAAGITIRSHGAYTCACRMIRG